MEYKNLIYKQDKNVGVLTISRPRALNALNNELLYELNLAIEKISKDETVFVLIITGEGKSFVAGADIGEMKEMSPESAGGFAKLGSEVFRKIELLDKPVIAAVNGFALGGGCELAMSCDLRIANEKAKFGQPEVGLGIIPGFSGTQRLSRLVGVGKAKELIFTGDIITADEAKSIGLINRVVPQENLMEECLKIAEKIASNGQIAVRYAKSAINRGVETDLETSMVIEIDLFSLCFAYEDQTEGMAAFLEKRKSKFKNKF